MPPEAKIYLIEDISSARRLAKRCLENAGHFVVAEADTFDIALEKIPEVKNRA